MASWYSNLLTKTSSQISSLQSRLLSSEADGDTEDDTHVCRVLRHHYTEAGRPFPPWLPADPRAPAAQAPVQPLYAQSQSQMGGRMPPGGQQQQQQQQQQGPGGGGLSSLWGDNNANAIPAGTPQSLRAGRGARGSSASPANLVPEDIQARPLPSQRAGSYQSVGGGAGGGPASTAQDRLKQRLWGSGSRGASPTQGAPFQAPPQQQQQQQQPMQPQQSTGNYEDRFAPGGGYGPPMGGGGGGQRRPGLPNGPRGYR